MLLNSSLARSVVMKRQESLGDGAQECGSCGAHSDLYTGILTTGDPLGKRAPSTAEPAFPFHSRMYS